MDMLLMSWRRANGIISSPVQLGFQHWAQLCGSLEATALLILGFQHWAQLCGSLEATALLILPETPGLESLTGSGLTTLTMPIPII